MRIGEEIQRLVAILNSMTMQRMEALRNGNLQEAMQIQAVQTDIDNKIQELEQKI
jgi:hypothetical protein